MLRVPLWCCLLFSYATAIAQDATASQEHGFSPGKRIRVSSQILGALLKDGANPVYPDEAIKAGIAGDVILILQTDEKGNVVRCLTVDGDPLLAAASIEALREFRFTPYLLNRVPIAVESQIEFKFVLRGNDDKAAGETTYTFQVPYRPEFRTGAVNENGVLVLSPRQISGPNPLLLPELSGKSGFRLPTGENRCRREG